MSELPFLVWALVALGSGLLIHQRWRIAGLQAEQGRYQAIFDNAMVGMANSTPALRWTDANPTLCQILDQSVANLTAVDWLDFVHPEDRPVTPCSTPSATANALPARSKCAACAVTAASSSSISGYRRSVATAANSTRCS